MYPELESRTTEIENSLRDLETRMQLVRDTLSKFVKQLNDPRISATKTKRTAYKAMETAQELEYSMQKITAQLGNLYKDCQFSD